MCKTLEKIKRDFLWGGGNLEKKPHLVKPRFAQIKGWWPGGQRITQAKQSLVRKVDLALRKRKESSVEGAYQKKVWRIVRGMVLGGVQE